MIIPHLTPDQVEQLCDNELDATQRRVIEQHLEGCPLCRARVVQATRIQVALRAVPHLPLPSDLVNRIETRVTLEQMRRARLPFLVLAMLGSLLVAGWFCLELALALQANGILDFWTLLTSYSEQFSMELLFALLEAVPLTETLLTVCALLTVGVFTQQLVETLRPRPIR